LDEFDVNEFFKQWQPSDNVRPWQKNDHWRKTTNPINNTKSTTMHNDSHTCRPLA
jgi:hypothetical protein